jgi:2'-5' RNA ligase
LKKCEARKFIPHLTLARTGPPAGRALLAAFQDAPGLDTTPWSVAEILLMRSVIDRHGAVHSVLARLPLGQNWK